MSAVHVPGGTFIHSAVALAPYSYILALEGVALAVAWVASRRRSWDAPTATRVFFGAVLGFAVVCAVVGSLVVHATWEQRRDRAVAVAATLDAAGAPATDRVMSIDAASTKYWTGHGGVVLINDPLDTVLDVAEAYDIRWLVLERESVPAAAARVLRCRMTAPALDRARPLDRESRPGRGRGEAPRATVAIYPVCLEPADSRCNATAAAS